MVRTRIAKWQEKKYAELWEELRVEAEEAQHRPVNHERRKERGTDASRDRAARSKVAVGELSHAVMTLMSDGIYTGPTDGLRTLFMEGREGDNLQWEMSELPEAALPDVSPKQLKILNN